MVATLRRTEPGLQASPSALRVTPTPTGYVRSEAARSRPREGRTVKFILIVLVVIVLAFLLFKYVLPGMRRR